MRDNLRRAPAVGRIRATAYDATAEARAMAALEANRGRAPIKPAPSAGKIAAAVLRPILPNRAMGLAELQRRWREIAGEQISKSATPEKLAAGVLTLKAPSALAPFIQHQIPLILERCKLAGASIKTIKVEHGALPKRDVNIRALPRVLTPEEERALAESVGQIQDSALQAALLRLGRAMARR